MKALTLLFGTLPEPLRSSIMYKHDLVSLLDSHDTGTEKCENQFMLTSSTTLDLPFINIKHA